MVAILLGFASYLLRDYKFLEDFISVKRLKVNEYVLKVFYMWTTVPSSMLIKPTTHKPSFFSGIIIMVIITIIIIKIIVIIMIILIIIIITVLLGSNKYIIT